jgi:hypothetical protein
MDGDVVAPGDYDGDGKFEVTVFRPSSAIVRCRTRLFLGRGPEARVHEAALSVPRAQATSLRYRDLLS